MVQESSSLSRRRVASSSSATGVDVLEFVFVFVVLVQRCRCLIMALTMHVVSSSSLCWHRIVVVIVAWPSHSIGVQVHTRVVKGSGETDDEGRRDGAPAHRDKI